MQETYQGNSFIDTIFITAIVILPKIVIKKILSAHFAVLHSALSKPIDER